MTRALTVAGADDPPESCFEMSPEGELPTCTYGGGEWHRSYDSELGAGDGVPGAFVLFFVLAVLAGVAGTIWKVSTARRMARSAGMDEGDATRMALFTDEGFEATYLASNLRGPGAAAPSGAAPGQRSTAERLRELQELAAAGLITAEERDERRRAILGEL